MQHLLYIYTYTNKNMYNVEEWVKLSTSLRNHLTQTRAAYHLYTRTRYILWPTCDDKPFDTRLALHLYIHEPDMLRDQHVMTFTCERYMSTLQYMIPFDTRPALHLYIHEPDILWDQHVMTFDTRPASHLYIHYTNQIYCVTNMWWHLAVHEHLTVVHEHLAAVSTYIHRQPVRLFHNIGQTIVQAVRGVLQHLQPAPPLAGLQQKQRALLSMLRLAQDTRHAAMHTIPNHHSPDRAVPWPNLQGCTMA